MTNVTQSQERLPCIVITDSLHRISCGIVIIHLTIAKHRDVIFISSVGYDSSSHQPFRKEAVAEILCALIAIYHKRIVQSCHILLSFIIQTFIALFTQRKLRNKKRDCQMFSSFLIIIIS